MSVQEHFTAKTNVWIVHFMMVMQRVYVCVCVCFAIDMGREAAQTALSDAGLSYTCIEAVVASYCYGDPTCGELHQLLESGI